MRARAPPPHPTPHPHPPTHPTPHTHTHPANDAPPLQAYSNSLVDHHLVLDLVPPLAKAYLAGRVPATLSYSQVRGCVVRA